MANGFHEQMVALLPRLRRFALGLTADQDRADDLVQAGCERALDKQAQWRAGSRLDSWMYKIIQNLWLDQLRAQRPVDSIDDEVGGDLARTLAEMGDDGQRRLEADMTLDRVLAAMAELPVTMRSVLMLVTVEGLSYKETADVLEVPIGTVMSRLARARAALLAKLDDTAAAGGSA